MRVAFGKFLAADFAGRIDARAGLVDDDIMHVFARELGAQDFGDQLFGLAAGGAVADRDHVEVVCR